MSETEHTGRCLCGAVRYRVTGEPKWIANCHCASCRRATGAPLTTYAGFPAERFAYVAGEPVCFHSSPGVTRTFCGRCGTPLTYQGERWPGEVHVLVGSTTGPRTFRRAAMRSSRRSCPGCIWPPRPGRECRSGRDKLDTLDDCPSRHQRYFSPGLSL